MKPCPFSAGINTPCDPDLIGVVLMQHQAKGDHCAYVECLDCGARGPVAFAVDEVDAMQLAERQWDGRATTPPEAEQ